MAGQDALIQDPMSIFTYLCGLVALIFWLGDRKILKPIFHFFPPLIFCYFLPMVSTTIGIIPDSSPLYGWFSKNFLLPTLILLLLSANIPAIIKLGPKAITIMLAGSLGMIIGAPIALLFFKGVVTDYAWQNLGSLVASWTGGSANMFALKEGFGIPDRYFAPMPIVDTVVGYGWMGVVIALAGYQEKFAQKHKIDLSILKELNKKIEQITLGKTRPITIRDLAIMLGVAFVIGHICYKFGYWSYDQMKPFLSAHNLAVLLDILKPYVLAIIIVTFCGLFLSMTPLSRLEEAGASKVGYTMLYLILTMYGSQTNLAAVVRTPWYMMIGVIMIVIHVACLYTATRLLRAPLFLFAVGSQSNIGGAATASIVAATYQPALAPVGILL
ncbi:DUF819 family protein, partial [Candidatus Sumerlaeota bacterium]|nr:DUF819 family protein [Candidatus Sumerlaeota bacterium]